MEFDLERFRDGDEHLFTLLIASYSRRLWPQLRRYATSDADARDLLQEVWVRAYIKRGSFDGRGSFAGWLFAVARTVGIALVRTRRRTPQMMELHDLADVRPHDDAYLRHTLREAVLALPSRQRDVVMLRLVEGMTVAATAQRLGCAEGTVKATLHQAALKLRESLKERV